MIQIPMFRDTDDTFLRSLGLMSTQYIFSPGDIVVYSGEVGREMFVIRRGLCEVRFCFHSQEDIKVDYWVVGD